MICLIRIRGQVDIDRDVKHTLDRLRLGKKYTCVVINPSKEQEGMIKKLRNHLAFGEIKEDVFEKMIEKRGQWIKKDKKIDSKKIADELGKGKKYEELGLKPYFRLHPPRGGIHSKLHFPRGVLGNNGEKINDLVLRML